MSTEIDRLKPDLPVRPLGKFDRVGSKWCPMWRPQRDENPKGIPAEFVIDLGLNTPCGIPSQKKPKRSE